jgi:sec-independent protein translocase protein TatC
VLSARTLHRFRRHAVVLCFVGGAVITPGGDIMSMSALAVPLYLLYEVSILLATIIERKRERRIAREAAEDRAAEDAEHPGPRSLMA